MVNVSDPVGSGLVASLARPGGNVTGSVDFANELPTKWLEFLRALVPQATRVAVLMSDNPVHPAQLRAVEKAAERIRLTVLPTMVRSPEELETTFASMVQQNAKALVVLGGEPFTTAWARDKMIELAAKDKIPAIYPGRWYADAGGLMSYNSPQPYRWTLTAAYIGKILQGAKPSDLPVQQPSEFELVINLKTAKALGLTIPSSLVLQANEIIQ